MRNVGQCNWEHLIVQEAISGEAVVPTLTKEGAIVYLADLSQAIQPGDYIEVTLDFKLDDAQSIDRKWLFVINGLSLKDKPFIELDIDNWVTVATITATPAPPTLPAYTSTPIHTPTPKQKSNPGSNNPKPPTRAP